MATDINSPMLLLIIMLIIVCESSTPITASGESSTTSSGGGDLHTTASFYNVLESNNLPAGLFPKDISRVSLDPTTGRFHLHLQYPSSSCKAEFESHDVRYHSEIRGRLSHGRISDLSGVSSHELFLWLPVRGIEVDIPSSGLIYFDVGVVLKQFSLSNFEIPKDCNALGEDEEGEDVVLFKDGGGRIVDHEQNKNKKKKKNGKSGGVMLKQDDDDASTTTTTTTSRDGAGEEEEEEEGRAIS